MQAKVPATLNSGEELLLVVRPSVWWTLSAYVFTLGLWHLWRKRHLYIVTNQRVIFTKGIINKSEASVALSRIQDMHVSASPLSGGKVKWSTAGGSLSVMAVNKVTRADARAFADAMRPLIGSAAMTAAQPALGM